MSEDILLAEAVFAHNCKIRQDTRLSPFQLVTGKQSQPPPIDDTGELNHSSIRLKHLGVQVQDKESGNPQEVTNQHTPPSLIACSVGLKDSPGSPRQEETLGAELVIKGDPQKLLKSSHSKPCKCGQHGSHDQSFPHNLKRKEEYKNFLCKTGLNTTGKD